MNDIWFKRLKYGWGWKAANWKGYLVQGIYTVLMAAYPIYYKIPPKEVFNTPEYILYLCALSFAAIKVCFWKGESPRWSWGDE